MNARLQEDLLELQGFDGLEGGTGRASWAAMRAIFFLTLVLLGGCGRWVDASPVSMPAHHEVAPADVYGAYLQSVRAAGYEFEELDHQHLYFRVRAKTADKVVATGNAMFAQAKRTTTYFGVQVHNDGSALLTPSGYYARMDEGRMHKKHKAEFDEFVAMLDQADNDVAPSGGTVLLGNTEP